MDREWSELNGEMQRLLKRKETFSEGIGCLLKLRDSLFLQITQIVNGYPREAFSAMPFIGAEGYHSKSLAYSIWHIFRIEDITAHELVARDRQIFFSDNWREKIHAPIVTTGNELDGEEISLFSAALYINELYRYAAAVKESTDEILKALTWEDMKRGFTETDEALLAASGCVSSDEKAFWLIEYWCSKDVAGLLRMPFSRHWIMHTEAMRRIKNRLCKEARKGVDPVAYCGFSCRHCFLGEWCGSCRTEYNTCSYALGCPGGVCPNVSCCRDKGMDGCWECSELERCVKGFYKAGNDGAAAAKAQAMFIRRYGKKEFLSVIGRLHAQIDFQKTQEVLGQDMYEGLKLLEKVRNG